MFRRNSFFIKILIPVIIVMLLQVGIIGIVLQATGTITSLEDAAIAKLTVNVETRGVSLEQMMVYYWSNLDRLEMNVAEAIDTYLADNGLSMDDVIGNYTHETKILDSLSHNMIDALRVSVSTGIFMVFLDKDGYREEAQTRSGIYYRDLDPLSNPADNSDIIYLKGFIDIARKDRIQLDSIWSEEFIYNPEQKSHWREFAYPQLAARSNPGASSKDLAYWSGPHLENPHSVLDSNPCISYVRPVFHGDRPVALLGSEVQLTHLEKYFPAGDFETGSRNGYMLLRFDDRQDDGNTGEIFFANGSYIKRVIGNKETLSIIPSRREGVYTAAPGELGESVQIALHPLRLYNNNAPFSNERWVLAAIGTDNTLFRTSRDVTIGLVIGFAASLALGGVLLAIIVRRATRPLISIAEQIEKSSGNDIQDISSDTDTYEIKLLCSTLNQMSRRRSHAEELVREERQRYLIALESATNTFMEYDARQDIFMLYYFTQISSNNLLSKTIHDFRKAVREGEFCHPDDIPLISSFLSSKDVISVELRARISVFSHINSPARDGEYYWFTVRASNIFDTEGNVIRIIGTAKEITEEKLAQTAREDAARRDPVTKFYNRDYGLKALDSKIAAAGKAGESYLLCAAAIENFDKLETFHGRVFGAFVLMQLSRKLAPLISSGDIAVRLSNDEFLFCFQGTGGNEGNAKMAFIEDAVSSLYTGENTNITLTAHIKTIITPDGIHQLSRGDKHISILLDVGRSNIVSSAFDLFERTTDVHSSIKVLLDILGDMFKFSRIAVCTFDADFGANKVSYQWAKTGLAPLGGGIERVSHADTAAFEALLDEDDTLFFTNKKAERFSSGVRKLLCLNPDSGAGGSKSGAGSSKSAAAYSAYCCVMYENAAHIGRVIFFSDKPRKAWDDGIKHDLCDIVKIISAHISIDRSRSASRAKSEFLSRVSHEIRTPMNAIIGMTDIAKSALGDPARLQDSLNQIDFSAKHLLTLINDVLEMSRIESGKLQIENKPFRLDDLISGIDTLMRVPIEKKDVVFTVNKNYSAGYVKGDEYRLRQVLVNLLGNAVKFTESGGEITLAVEQLDSDSFKFSVADTGIGISPEDQLHVFDAFEQAAEVKAGQQEGTGLGLAISGSIVSAMGGKIELDSMPGEGSEFSFAVKLEQCGPQEPAGGGAEDEDVDYTGWFEGKRALLVDDVNTNVAVAMHTLSETGIQIDVACDGQQAVDMWSSSSPGYYDIIFMDVKMPVMDGFTATRQIRSNTRRSDASVVPIVAMTANAYDEDMKKTVESGMNGHITKPIEKDKLFGLMKKLFES